MDSGEGEQCRKAMREVMGEGTANGSKRMKAGKGREKKVRVVEMTAVKVKENFV